MYFFRTLVLFFIVGLLSIPAHSQGAALDCSATFENDTQEQLEARLKQCEQEINAQAVLVQIKQREATTLERDLAILSHRISKAKLEIKARDITIKRLAGDIAKKGAEIEQLNAKMGRLKSTAGELIRKTEEIDSHSPLEFLLANRTLTDFFETADAYESVQEQLTDAVDEIRDTKTETETQQKILEEKKQNEDALKAVQELERQKAQLVEKEKNSILKQTKGQEKKYQAVLSEKQSILNGIKNKILKFVGGVELKFPEALRLARIPEQAVGVRAAFILSVLTQESGVGGVIGANLGKCFYNTARNNASGSVMKNDQKPHFLALMKDLGMNPETTPVSCPIAKDGAYGGAMGPAQFMPMTWWNYDKAVGYKGRIEKLLGISQASPFNNMHAFTATALYLSDALVGCKETYSTQFSQESCAAGKYYAGGNWKSHMNGYGKSVANRAVEFQKDIDILDVQ